MINNFDFQNCHINIKQLAKYFLLERLKKIFKCEVSITFSIGLRPAAVPGQDNWGLIEGKAVTFYWGVWPLLGVKADRSAHRTPLSASDTIRTYCI